MDQNDLMARAAWLYHMEGLTQAQIADRLNLTRRRVNEMLATALRDRVVTISFNGILAECAALESRLCERFGLEGAIVVPTPDDTRQLHTILGRAAANWFDRFIVTHDIGSLGVGWGTTLRETVHFMTPVNRPHMEVHSMMGGLTHGSEINTFEIVRGFAQVFSGRCQYLVAPIYAESAESREAIISQTVFRRTFDTICNVDLAYLSVGDVSDRSLQVRYGLPEGVTATDLLAHGAVGDIAGRYLDERGIPIDHPINAQVLSPELADFARIRHRVVAGGGSHKIDIVRAVLKQGLATVLLTDSANAQSLLQ
ncbi:sugar-binding transcriptional regulator [Pelagibacterium sp. 26DY04]|uniref:sugar-binding transcriptional regulator n=1 Tax=Pelagibacterium sp. 26DY04 TaxID=2967130 RepID=UPI0028149E5F|nr:sugar-binding transcriptional regulator [Pelagibacterium sp. 26DY04]WMT87164.1 sugar-binding transcriptional regulator [Pelagibacterium sp. 26DY04]